MNRGNLLDYKTIGYAVVIVLLIGGIVLFNPEIFLQAAPAEPTIDPTTPVDGIDPIYLSSFTCSPSSPTPADEVDVSCKATGATSAMLYYDYTDNPIAEPNHVSMISGSNDMWYGKIPMKAEGIAVTYWIKASNSDGSKTTSISSYIVSIPSTETTTDPITFSATFVVYKQVTDGWQAVPEGGTLSGRIKIELQVTSGMMQVDAARMSFWNVVDGDWVRQDYIGMSGIEGVEGGFKVEYDTTKLENTVYDIRYELLDTGGAVVYEQSLFDSDGLDLGLIDQTSLLLGLVCIIGVGVLVFLFKKHWK